MYVQDGLANKEYVVYLIDAGCDMMLPFEKGVRSLAHNVKTRGVAVTVTCVSATRILQICFLFGS